jgi:hypothetical protein
VHIALIGWRIKFLGGKSEGKAYLEDLRVLGKIIFQRNRLI